MEEKSIVKIKSHLILSLISKLISNEIKKKLKLDNEKFELTIDSIEFNDDNQEGEIDGKISANFCIPKEALIALFQIFVFQKKH